MARKRMVAPPPSFGLPVGGNNLGAAIQTTSRKQPSRKSTGGLAELIKLDALPSDGKRMGTLTSDVPWNLSQRSIVFTQLD
ncbi:hypothetical protein FRC06_003589 [Ceratobasidium sp. 370]|nr:hypothetical protein FRC06_003589 [Ceratobasidium sp. 370]